MLADFGLIVFDPDSTVEDIRANFDFLRDMGGAGQAPLSFGRMEVYAGTPILDRMQREDRLAGSYLAWNCTIADPSAELLRRLARIVFGSRNAEEGLCSQIAQIWYELLLLHRFRPQRSVANKARILRDIVIRLNSESMAVRREMLSFAAGGDLLDAGCVNEFASAQASRVKTLDMAIGEELLKASMY